MVTPAGSLKLLKAAHGSRPPPADVASALLATPNEQL